MTPEQALKCHSMIEGLLDGSPEATERAVRLLEVLTTRPDDFVEEWHIAHLDDGDEFGVTRASEFLSEAGTRATFRDLRFALDLESRRIEALAANVAREQAEQAEAAS